MGGALSGLYASNSHPSGAGRTLPAQTVGGGAYLHTCLPLKMKVVSLSCTLPTLVARHRHSCRAQPTTAEPRSQLVERVDRTPIRSVN